MSRGLLRHRDYDQAASAQRGVSLTLPADQLARAEFDMDGEETEREVDITAEHQLRYCGTGHYGEHRRACLWWGCRGTTWYTYHSRTWRRQISIAIGGKQPSFSNTGYCVRTEWGGIHSLLILVCVNAAESSGQVSFGALFFQIS